MATLFKKPTYADVEICAQGWKDKKTGELLEARRFTEEEIAEYNKAKPVKKPVVKEPEAPKEVVKVKAKAKKAKAKKAKK